MKAIAALFCMCAFAVLILGASHLPLEGANQAGIPTWILGFALGSLCARTLVALIGPSVRKARQHAAFSNLPGVIGPGIMSGG